ncbi:MAG TPA: alpha-amylase family glycosyl hydrolase [Gaiellaceae bacterium]|nr:alpha-amylase family glycosyl hydrolase [Gaiellaceae bacterium]
MRKLLLLVGIAATTILIPSALASHTPAPTSVTIAGSLQSELGCSGDWQQDCAATHLTYDASDQVWQGSFSVPAGSWEYKAPLNDSWTENYGANAQQDGPNIALDLASSTSVKFYYSHATHWITDDVNSVIATAPGDYQSELGCPGDWQPDCLRSWLQDPDGDGVYSFDAVLPVGNYETKVAIDEGWAENYGAGGVPNGPNIALNVPSLDPMRFSYNSATHVLTIAPAPAPGQPGSVTIAGDLQSELGCASDWDPACAATHLSFDSEDQIWQGSFAPPAGNYEYKAALDDSWDENYGLHAQPGGANIPLTATGGTVKFYYSHATHWITDNVNSVIATAPGSYQSELGCSGDWDPACLRSWLQDPDADGIYVFQAVLPPGTYAAKAAINEGWDVNYGAGGVQNGPDIPFTVSDEPVKFSYNATTHVLTIQTHAGTPNDIEWDGVRHDSRDPLYRTPGGAVETGTAVTLRLRTFHDDVTRVRARVYDLNANGASLLEMHRAASDVSCYQAGLGSRTCDFWEVTVTRAVPDNLWYRFVVTDGTDTDYYDDDTAALDGGLGGMTDDQEDNSFALMFYDPAFASPAWARDAVVYQLFPDRFRNGKKNNDPKTGDVRYDDPVLALPWGTLPEGYCRNYADANTNCPWRFDTTPPDWSPTKEQPRGRDYFGGDLDGVVDKLDYLRDLGITAIYFNPLFDAASNHGYDTQDYYKVEKYFGGNDEWDQLRKEAKKRGIRLILDGVFNHMSSDSPLFDRYHHYKTLGACESKDSPWRPWFYFNNNNAPCGAADYVGWFGFDSIPVLKKDQPDVQDYFLTGDDSVTRHWLKRGASGWRLDVMGDSSFPNGYWESFRNVVKETDPNALILGELWQKDSTLLRHLRGDRADSTMNYRLRDAVLGLLSPNPFDSKGFADSGHPLTASQFASRIASIREDYPDAAYYSLLNLLDSHDTERILWTLTPGDETRAAREQNGDNVAEGKARLRIASLIQFTMPGMPTVYYGDEVGLTGDDDPDDRRTYPWVDLGGNPDGQLRNHYKALAALRKTYPVLAEGDFRVLAADDAADTVAYGRKTGDRAAIVVVNAGDDAQATYLPTAGFVPDGTAFNLVYAVNGANAAELPARSAAVFVTGVTDLTPPAAPSGLAADAGTGHVQLTWNAVAGAAGYNVYRSPLSGGGYAKVNGSPVAGTGFDDTGVENGRTYYYVVRALDAAGNESEPSNEVSALPHLTIGWANLQWPPTMNHTISAVNRTDLAYGQVWIDGETSKPGATPTLVAQLGFGPTGSPVSSWTWEDAVFNADVGNNDEFKASLLPEATGTYWYAYRYSTTNGQSWLYADQSGPFDTATPPNPGVLTVVASDDTTAPAAPSGLHVVSPSPEAIELAWDAVAGDPSLYGYEVLRSQTAGGPYTQLARVTGTSYVDGTVVEGNTYFYVVRSVDTSFNRSGNSNEVSATAQRRTVTLVFNVTVPASTDGTGRSVYIAGFLDRLDGNLPQWDPGGVVLTRVDATHWTRTFTGLEGTQLEYKYTLGDWEHVEKDGVCGEINNRMLTLSYGSNGAQTVNDSVQNWRNVAPCGN